MRADPPTVAKVLAYVVRDGRVLVFRHRDDPEAGLQVPGGTVREGEPPDDAVRREAEEETGLRGLAIRRFLGRQRYDMSAHRPEVQERHVYQLDVPGRPPEEWLHHEENDGLAPPIAFRFFWLPLDDPRLDELAAGQGALLDRVEP